MEPIDWNSLFARYPDDGLTSAATEHRVADVEVAAAVTSEPRFFVGKRTHALHETFSVVTEHGLHLDVIDNIDLAPRLPVHAGDTIVIAGQFIPRRNGGIIHDTHHCPGPGWHRGGWIEWHGHRFETMAHP